MSLQFSKPGRLAAAGALFVLVAAGAYYVGRVYPPHDGPTAGTIAPAERYRSSQVQASDVALGDTTVPMLMQTDAFELMIKNPGFRALAADPAFMVLAQNPAALTAMAQNPQAFLALAHDHAAFSALAAENAA